MILHGDALDVLRTLPENSVQMCVTSPPYWSLRDYQVPPSIWGGDALCVHVWQSAGTKEGYAAKTKWQHSMTNTPESARQTGDKKQARAREDGGWTQVEQGQFCAGCDAWRGCLGLEPTIELYVAHLVTVFEQVRRVLRKDGTCWLNLGDSYVGAGRGGDSGTSGLQGSTRNQDESKRAARTAPPGLKGKDLCMIPARVALALQAAGWYLRSDIVWAKTNPMPESTKDRPTKSHEFIYLLAKSEKYFYDADAIRESHTTADRKGPRRSYKPGSASNMKDGQHETMSGPFAGLPLHPGGRNRRSVWTFATSPYKGAHFATFPPRLVEPCILAGTSAHGCCALCGAPWKRLVALGAPIAAQMKVAGATKDGRYRGKATKAYAGTGAQDPSATKARILDGMRERITVGWAPTCRHELPMVVPCVVLDPFAGTGTTGMVAARHGRAFILIELSVANIALTEERLAAVAPLFQVPA
jgi:DNA modification methylase